MQGRDGRLDGWKSIARYLGRDRSTVIRWTNDRALPVHSLPGGKSRTVYALQSELDAWMRNKTAGTADDLAAPLAAPEVLIDPKADAGRTTAVPATVPATKVAAWPRGYRWLTLGAAGLVGVFIVAAGLLMLALNGRAAGNDPALPAALEARLLDARDDIASRSAVRLDKAIADLRRLTGEARNHAGVHAALAEGYLLAREFGTLPDPYALKRARHEAELALARNPRSAVALRVVGVVAYWNDHQPDAAGEAFRRAIAADPEDALAHHWYANILADNGEFRPAFREFAAARQRSPGAPHLLADYAWALWSAGREVQAERLLNDIARRSPMLASAHDCLSVIAFARGDLKGYAHHLKLRASIRGAPELVSYAALIERTGTQDARATYAAMASRALAQAETASNSDHSWPAFVASTFGDRAQLYALLSRARARGEKWGAAGYVRRIAARWSSDPQITALLRTLSQPKIEA
ncbi:tetratricopeptide repeat protein [Sphingomonas sp. TZW2008]|uniref:tetratricopeptide repeat protein n=1 Tax=Sphingomonas sp. TZW2008 TaxID=1917973 RepID=UPI000A270D9A|nr:tetratricopeptide repeat protein [Sphingomonas sp. TZW2008]